MSDGDQLKIKAKSSTPSLTAQIYDGENKWVTKDEILYAGETQNLSRNIFRSKVQKVNISIVIRRVKTAGWKWEENKQI
ncbi:hypothetical protein IGI04_035783, partial [Brassica rapa subsp. trilocularis]